MQYKGLNSHRNGAQIFLVGICALCAIIVAFSFSVTYLTNVYENEVKLTVALKESGVTEEESSALIEAFYGLALTLGDERVETDYAKQFKGFEILANKKSEDIVSIFDAYLNPQGKNGNLLEAIGYISNVSFPNAVDRDGNPILEGKSIAEIKEEIFKLRKKAYENEMLNDSRFNGLIEELLKVAVGVAENGEDNYLKLVGCINKIKGEQELSVKEIFFLFEYLVKAVENVDFKAVYPLDLVFEEGFSASYGNVLNDVVSVIKEELIPNKISIIEYFPDYSALTVYVIKRCFNEGNLNVLEASALSERLLRKLIPNCTIDKEEIAEAFNEFSTFDPDALTEEQREKVLAFLNEITATNLLGNRANLPN